MDYSVQTTLTVVGLIVSGVGVHYARQQVVLMRRQMSPPIETDVQAEMPRFLRLKLYGPIAVLMLLVLLSWIPYLRSPQPVIALHEEFGETAKKLEEANKRIAELEPLEQQKKEQQKQDEEQEKQWRERRKHAFVGDHELEQLRQMFFSIPRPCVVKVTAHKDNTEIRGQILVAAKGAWVQLLDRQWDLRSELPQESNLNPCQIEQDEYDQNPGLYADQPTYPSPGVIRVETKSTYPNFAKFVAGKLTHSTQLRVEVGPELQPDDPTQIRHSIYIKIGPGDLR